MTKLLSLDKLEVNKPPSLAKQEVHKPPIQMGGGQIFSDRVTVSVCTCGDPLVQNHLKVTIGVAPAK